MAWRRWGEVMSVKTCWGVRGEGKAGVWRSGKCRRADMEADRQTDKKTKKSRYMYVQIKVIMYLFLVSTIKQRYQTGKR